MPEHPLTPMWVLLWNTNPETEKRPHYTMERMTKVMADAHAQGIKDGHQDSLREGVEMLGKAIRERVDVDSFYMLKQVMEEWNA